MAAVIAKVIRRLEYAPPAWHILSVNLLVQIFDGETRVQSTMKVTARGQGESIISF